MSVRLDDLEAWLLDEHAGTVDPDRLTVVRSELTRMVGESVAGVVVELGCFRGAMSVWMRAVLDDAGDTDREIWVFDSFRGLPEPGEHDSDHLGAGEIATTVPDFLATHDKWQLRYPVIHEGWFEETLPRALTQPIAFAYLDGDFYDSILVSLEHTVPLLSRKGALIIDDYADVERNPRAWNGLPGVKRASDHYFGLPSPVEVVAGTGDLAFGRYRR
ncbi:hypothetical protein GCM10009557_17840 [Virgisporangium ochraceum]|uniref:Methyltransferase n=1 Tax=Virgisporangium ochraceum TaxID=65505 RepID=A0A8J4A4Q0_9ACTN|nr:TylF/MycF/NovP-related O-methyltransferase [Virgisporangium ochraceum]GIJ72681.1 hypothetical protein Voc01_075980 [Virgisporangium ochraceum]